MQKAIFAMLFTIVTGGLANGRLLEKDWSYQEMFDKADLVVIGRCLSTTVTGERTTLSDINPAMTVAGVITQFETRLVLKGDKKLRTFALHHYRLEHEETMINGPQLIDFQGKEKFVFLLFLVREADGKYAPVTGQTDPSLFSITELKNVAD
jgi:hypothetical protein